MTHGNDWCRDNLEIRDLMAKVARATDLADIEGGSE